MKPVFLDTSGLIALTDKDDAWHSRAVEVWQTIVTNRREIVTTSLVLIELADGLAKVRFRKVAIQLVDALHAASGIEVVHVLPELESLAWKLYRKREDKDWGMTDCVSISLMTNRGMIDVFGADHHFSQAGFNLLIYE